MTDHEDEEGKFRLCNEIEAELRDPLRCSLDTIARAVGFLEANRDDDEFAHGCEDEFRDAVLEAIYLGAKNPKALAEAIRNTRLIEFCRWCS